MRRQAPPPPTAQTVHLPAPVGGLNTVAAGASMPDGDCVSLVNMVAGEHGLRVRLGYTSFATGVTDAIYSTGDDRVLTLMPFVGSAANGSKDRLFAATPVGIFDITTGTPVLHVIYGAGGGASKFGYGTSHTFTTSAGNFLLFCGEDVGGLLVYSETTDGWSIIAEGGGAGEISGVNPANFSFVGSWKSRIWFLEKDTTNVWYLPAGAIFGAATKLPLAQSAQFRHGGDLIGFWNWTLDGGSGIDDLLVFATRGGDVAVYQGTDPASANTFALKGTWNAGAFVAGKRVASNFGGDLLLLTKSGIRSLSQLVSGGDGQGTFNTTKISNLFNTLALTRGDLRGWSIHVHPEENALIITVPTYAGGNMEQLAQQLWNRSWSVYRDLPMQSACVWRKQLYFGTGDGRVRINTGHTDGGSAIAWGLIMPFRNGDGRQKQVQLIRPLVLSEGSTTAYSVESRYGYNLAEMTAPSLDSAAGNVWDVATWDAGTFRDYPLSTQHVRGATGVGTDFSIAIKGVSETRTSLVGIDVALTQGGFL